MKYSEFRDRAFKEIMGYMPEEYAGYDVKLERVTKINHTKECFYIRPDDKTSVVPNLYVDDLYNAYLKGKSFEETMRMAVQYYIDGLKMGKEFAVGMNDAIHEGNIVFQLINSNRNFGMLKDKPHRKWLNLTIIYRAVITTQGEGFYSTVITNDIARSNGWDEEDLYRMAMKNAPMLLPLDMLDVTDSFLILTNEYRTMGAATVLYENILEELADDYDDNLYLIPSSIHEMLVLPAGEHDSQGLKNILMECNRNVLDVHEILSDTVYCYEKDSRRIYEL